MPDSLLAMATSQNARRLISSLHPRKLFPRMPYFGLGEARHFPKKLTVLPVRIQAVQLNSQLVNNAIGSQFIHHIPTETT